MNKHSKRKIDEAGNVTVIAMALCCIAIAFAYGLGRLGGFAGVKGKAQNAADAASLSAAYEIAHFMPSKACASAKNTALKNGAVMTKCSGSSNNVEIEVKIEHDGETVKAKAKAYIK